MLVRRYEMPWRRAYEVYAGISACLHRWRGKARQIEAAHAARVKHDADGGIVIEIA